MIEKRKVVLVGTGFVGMSMVYSIVNQGIDVNEIVLIDVLKDKAEGEAMDISDGIPCSPSHMVVKAGDYSECSDADIVVITAGLNQKPGQTRLELSEANAKIMKNITNQVVKSGFKGIFLVASNPVDIMTKVVQEVSNFPTNKVIGSGTALDTSRLRYQVGKYLDISSKNIHAYVMGEHGDSSFVPWEHAYVGCKRMIDIIRDSGKNFSALDKIYVEVRDSAYEIINRKKATYYGIGIGLAKIVKNILNDTNEILTVSAYLNGEYGHKNIYIGTPAVINSNGAREIVELDLSLENQKRLDKSCEILTEYMEQIREKVL